MELETSGQITRIPALDDDFDDTPVNKITHLTRFADGIANYTLNFLNVGIFETTATTKTPLSTILSTVSSTLSSSSSSPSPSSSSSLSSLLLLLSTANYTTTATTATTATATPTPIPTLTLTSSPIIETNTAKNFISNSLLAASSTVPSFQNATETVFATLANGIVNAITSTIYSYNEQQLPTTTTTDINIISNTNTNTTVNNIDPSLLVTTGNESEFRILDHAPQLSKSAMVKVYVLSVMAFLSLLGNIMTMWNIYKTRISRRSSRHSWSAIYSLIFHLSIADVLVTGFCIIGEAAWCYTVQWLADEITCKLVKFFQMFSLYLSTYVLVLIGVDRWIAVKYPMKSLNMAKRCYRLLGGTYVLSLLLSLPQSFIFHVARGPFVEEFYQCVTHGFYTAEWQEQLYTTFTLIFTFLLPLCILFGTYLSSFRTIASSEKMFQGSKLTTYSSKPTAQTNRQRLIHKAKMKSLRISVVIIFAFLICWTPYYVMMMIFMFWNPDKRFGEDLQSAIFFFGMSNSLVNPLIYGAFHLCPMKRKTSKYSNNPAHSLNRGDSQRTPSMLTAVTQVDNHGRQVRTYRPSYYRTQSNGSSNNYKEHVSLLQVTPTPSIMRKNTSTSFRSNCKAAALTTTNSPHSTAVLLSYDSGNSPNSSRNRCSSDSYCVQETLLGKHFLNSSGNNTKKSDNGFSTKDRHSLVIGTNENISIV